MYADAPCCHQHFTLRWQVVLKHQRAVSSRAVGPLRGAQERRVCAARGGGDAGRLRLRSGTTGSTPAVCVNKSCLYGSTMPGKLHGTGKPRSARRRSSSWSSGHGAPRAVAASLVLAEDMPTFCCADRPPVSNRWTVGSDAWLWRRIAIVRRRRLLRQRRSRVLSTSTV